jgi:hypothetical protein
MNIGLSIVFTGLCALVTDGERGSGQVLLVDAKGVGQVGGVALPEHAPTLVVSLANLANAESSRPSRVIVAWPGDGAADGSASPSPAVPGQVGLWDLSGSEVRIRVPGGASRGLRVFRASDGSSSWPQPPRNANEPASWRDVRFVADMATLTGDGRIDPKLVAPLDGSARLPSSVSTRIQLDGGSIEAGVPSDETYRHDWFEFRGSGQPRLRQALTDTIRWSLDAEADAVVIEITPVSGGPGRQLVFKPRTARHQIFISNMPVEVMGAAPHHAMGVEEMAAMHFGAYYKLLKNPPADEPLPRLWVRPAAEKGAGVIGPVMCPPAIFTRD